MRVLVYGAGGIGCEMAHMLCKSGSDVTLLARGEWGKTIGHNGLIIRHYAQFHTTVDRVKTIESLEHDDIYDLIFVVMQCWQLPDVLPIVAQNRSQSVVIVGNNMDTDSSLKLVTDDSPVEKHVAFGFQGTGGRRENGKIISVHVGVGMTVGGQRAALRQGFRTRIAQAFDDSGYTLKDEHNMDAWYKSHVAFILPIAYVCYATGFRLAHADRRQLSLVLDAAMEGFQMLKTLGYPIRPDGEEEAFTTGRKKLTAMLWVMAKTPLGRLAASDHCKNAGMEMLALDKSFEALRKRAGVPMPSWDCLRRQGNPADYVRGRAQ